MKQTPHLFQRLLALFLCLILFLSCLHLGAVAAEPETSDTVTITVNYVYAANQSMVAQPYRAQIPKGDAFQKSLSAPRLLGYTVPSDAAQGLGSGITLSQPESGGDYCLEFQLPSVAEDITVTLYYVAGTAKYTVYHSYQNLLDDGYTRDPRVVELIGDIDAYTQAPEQTLPGFYCTGIPQTTIAADGTTEVEIYYDRHYYTVTFDVNGGISGPAPIYARYGTVLDTGSIPVPSRAGYTFMGWDPALCDGDLITENRTYRAVWQPEHTQSDYTIVLWGQNANDDEYSYIRSYSAWGNVGSEVTWQADALVSHVHGEDCYTPCPSEAHVHQEVCYGCGLLSHTHSEACCTLTEHSHQKDCYADVGNAASTGSLGKPENPTEGQVYQGRLGTYIYIGGQWYVYTGTAESGETVRPSCGLDAHTHGTGCIFCEQPVHIHDETCLICQKQEHRHSDACRSLLCTEDDTPVTMGSYALNSNLWNYEKCQPVTVNADGTTVLNVYFTRKVFTLGFRRSGGTTDTYGTITARWGQDIKARYEAITASAGSSFWTENTNAQNGPYTNYIGVMPQRNITYYLHTTEGSQKNVMTYYAEDLNGAYQEIFRIEFYGNYVVTVEDRYEFEGFTYDHGTGLGESCNNATFYYKRNTYTLDFFSASLHTPEKQETVSYQAPLSPYGFTPTGRPDTLEPDAVFVGWYQNPQCTGQPYDLSAHTMPSHNMALYAKWVNGLYTVRTFTSEDLTTLYTYEGYSGLQESIVKYTLAEAPEDPRQDGYLFAGWFYRDGEEEKPFSFTMPITRDYDLYPKFTEPLTLSYTVHYYKKGTTEKLATDRVNWVKAGSTVTEKAKLGTDLDLLDATSQNRYFPVNTSTSVIVDRSGIEILFEYTEASEVAYTVYYQDAEGNDLIDPVRKTTDYSVVTEYYVAIAGYAPRQYSIVAELSSEEANNRILFLYDPALTTLTVEKTGVSPEDAGQTFLFRVTGTDDSTRGIDLTVTIHGNGRVTLANLPIGSYTVVEDTDWSWRYTPDSRVKTVQAEPRGNTVTFCNSRTEDRWLDGNSYAVNLFANTEGRHDP